MLRVCFLGGARYSQPLDRTADKQFRSLTALGELFVIGFSTNARPRRFTQHAHFYLLPQLPLPILRYVLIFTAGSLIAFWLSLTRGVRILVAQSPYEGFAAALVKRIAQWFGRRVALIVESHGDFEESIFLERRVFLPRFYRYLMSWTARWALKHADALRAISHSTRQQLETLAPGRPVFQFPAWTDLDVFFESSSAHHTKPGAALLYAGVLIPRKGVHHLVEALSQIGRYLPDIRLGIVGRAKNRAYVDELEKQVESLGLNRWVQFIGDVPQQELAQYMAACRVFVLPSLSEGLGRVVVEAMACGRPVVGSCVGGIPEMVKDGETGFLVPPGDVDALADRLIWLLTHPREAEQMGNRAREFARRFFSTEGYVQNFARVFDAAHTIVEGAVTMREGRRLRLLLFNLATDADDPILGFTTRWIQALASRSQSIHVITMRAGRIELPTNAWVLSVGKEKGYSELRRAVEFYRLLFDVLRRDAIDVCFSHMIPIFTVLAAPVLKARGIPIVTWHAHPSLTSTLKLAHHLSDRIVASLPTAYPYKHDKLTVVGQGIDTELFAPDGTLPQGPPIVLCVGRLSPVKDHPTLLRAAALLRERGGERFHIVIVGQPAGPQDEAYVRSLHEQAQELGIQAVVRFEPPVRMVELPSWYRRCMLHVNLTPTGFGDKVAWEAMSCGRPCLVANPGFRETLGRYADRLLFRYGDPEGLAERLAWILSLSEDERTRMGAYLREQVVGMHSLERLADRLIELFGSYSKTIR